MREENLVEQWKRKGMVMFENGNVSKPRCTQDCPGSPIIFLHITGCYMQWAGAHTKAWDPDAPLDKHGGCMAVHYQYVNLQLLKTCPPGIAILTSRSLSFSVCVCVCVCFISFSFYLSVFLSFCLSVFLSFVQDQDNNHDDDEDIQYAADLGATFAPRDVRAVEFTRKADLHGIGYTPLSAKVCNLLREIQ